MAERQITQQEAATAIEAAAWEQQPGDEAYRRAVEALAARVRDDPGPYTGDDIMTVIHAHVPAPVKRIHTFAGSGADWDLDAAVAFARTPGAACAWHLRLMSMGHDLRITAAGRTVWFEVTAPEPVRSELAAALRQQLADLGHEVAGRPPLHVLDGTAPMPPPLLRRSGREADTFPGE
jgi:hypothetical protein